MMAINSSDFIDQLGGTGVVSRHCRVQLTVVSNWRKRGISWRYRFYLARFAKAKNVTIPDDFIGRGMTSEQAAQFVSKHL